MSTRKLAAILFADIAGYTAMMQEDEVQTILLRDKFRKKLESEVKLHRGEIIKYSGDGALCSFDSAIESIRATLAVQLFMQADPAVPLRIGIHQADVIFDDGDVHGDGVNIASRLESMAVTGSILISAKVYDDIKNQKDIQTVSLGKYVLKNVKEPVEVFAISNTGLQVPVNKSLEGKAERYREHVSARVRIMKFARPVLPVLVLVLLAAIFVPRWMKKQHARTVLIPSIQKLVDDNFRPPTQAFDMALEAEKYIPEDSALLKLWPVISTAVTMETEPAGAEVFWKDYNKPDAEWRSAGITPLRDSRFPRGYLRLEIRKKGYQTIEYAGPWTNARLGADIDTLKMEATGSLPDGMVRIPKRITQMYIVGLEEHGGKEVPEFLIDKFEVTNGQFKAFMDAGGYTNKSFWKYPIYSNGKYIKPEEALANFTDHTGRQGPATWEAGMYPDGQEHHPVTGISWYEAAAYASYAGKQLPTVFHWSAVAATSRTELIVPLSNFNGKSTVAVGSLPGYSDFGIYDLAGNVREWCFNEKDAPGLRFVLGGGWNDPSYSFNDGNIQSALDRSIANGFRCIKELQHSAISDSLSRPLVMAFRDYWKEKPVDDQTFEIILRQYAYDKSPLNVKIDSVFEGESWTAEKISFDAGYNNERIQLYLYLPKGIRKPYQPILFFPGSGDIYARKYDVNSIEGRIDFILKSGRALVRPVYKGTFERHDELNSDLQQHTVFYKDHVIMWRKDIGRTIDYLESRSDIQHGTIGYLGWSWGGFMGGILPAIEKRIKAVVLNVGGMEMHKAMPEADQINFLPRVTQPVLMLNGKHDMYFPVETSQKPMFNFLGTPKDKKKMIVYESGHLVPRTDFVKETLLWYDTYLGPVK
jgi:class 3 adenylate cyclase/formylglycine-generating enzyme required for sulfatase activity/dienelactone hydrolase